MSVKPDRISAGTKIRNAVTENWYNRINDILWGLDVLGGEILRYDDKNWRIVFGGGGPRGGRWTGIYWILNDEYNVLDDYDVDVFNLTGDGPPDDEPVLTGWNSDGEWYGWIRGEYFVVRTDGGEYDGTEYDGEYNELGYRFTDDFGDWDDEIEKVFRVATVVDATGDRDEGWRLNDNTQGDIHVFGAAEGGRWSGVLWFGNERIVVDEPANLTKWDSESETVPTPYIGTVDGEYLVVNLRGEGSPIWRFERSEDGEWDDAEEQVFHVAEEVEATAEREEGFRLISATQGDIHARIT